MKIIALTFIALIVFSCAKWTEEKTLKAEIVNESYEIVVDPFLVTPNSVGIFKKGMTIGMAVELISEKQIIKKIGYGEFQDDIYDGYEIYDSNSEHLLTITPKAQNDLNSTINTILIVDNRFKTKSGIGSKSTYSELVGSFKINDYAPDLDRIVLTVDQLGAWFSIKKTELEVNWWDFEKKKIDISKIPADSKFDTFVIWWD